MLPRDVHMIHAFDFPLELLVRPRHQLASERTLTPDRLRKLRIWVPGIIPRSEWAESYDELVTVFDPRVDATGPDFGNEVLLDTLVDPSDVAPLVAARDRYIWPTNYDPRCIPIVKPTLAYPLSLMLPKANPHPGLRAIIEYFAGPAPLPGPVWLPSWARSARRRDGDIAALGH